MTPRAAPSTPPTDPPEPNPTKAFLTVEEAAAVLRIGRTAAVMLGSTETTFYVLAVYFGACGVRRSRWAIPAAIAADLTGFLVAAALVRWIWGA